MADTISSSSILYMGFEREDESTQYVKLQNPKYNISADETRSVMNYLVQNKILLDSKTDNVLPESSVLTSYTENKTTINLDL